MCMFGSLTIENSFCTVYSSCNHLNFATPREENIGIGAHINASGAARMRLSWSSVQQRQSAVTRALLSFLSTYTSIPLSYSQAPMPEMLTDCRLHLEID